MRHILGLVLLLFTATTGLAASTSYLFVWAGDDAKTGSWPAVHGGACYAPIGLSHRLAEARARSLPS